ncbi:uncharacterized protein LOC130054096 [Ostrea edulis]|uniref:uncharacterized protein LOC130054096 n=1 Tax=Ostrea edulis TaxID=37623 RepID=UPI0024AFA22B|nr:uncharacterized protein LOC130054096 [Ostrea edulis]
MLSETDCGNSINIIAIKMSASVFAFIIALFVCHIQNNLTDKHPSGICKRTRTGVECCTDYVKDGNKCLRCLGSFGPQCSKKCLPGFYGFGCKMKCTCGVCDRFNGSCLEGVGAADYPVPIFKEQK